MSDSLGENSLLQSVLDAFPSPVIVLDDSLEIVDFNTAAGALLGPEPRQVIQRRNGDALHCIHSTETDAGCGGSAHCKSCIVNESVRDALGGKNVVRRKERMHVLQEGGIREMHLLVTTAPFEHEGRSLVLLVLEDVGELIALRSLLPICAGCKRIRDDENYWHEVEAYIAERVDVDFSHGFCPDCLRKLYPEVAEAQGLTD